MRRALAGDVPKLVSLMAEFYAEAGYGLDRPVAERGFRALLADERLGSIWLIEDDRQDAGYLVLTLKFAMEYAGLIACIDDLYVAPSHRNRGLAAAALAEVRERCRASGVRAITVEVAFGNAAAQAVYRRIGLVAASDRQLLSLALAEPTHVV